MATKYDVNQSIIDGVSSNPIDAIDEQPRVSLPDPTNPEDQPQFEKMAGLGSVILKSITRKAPEIKARLKTGLEATPEEVKSQLETAIRTQGTPPQPGGPSIKSRVKAVQTPVAGPTLTPEGVITESAVEKARIQALPTGSAKPTSEVFNYSVIGEDGDLSGVISAIGKYAGIATEKQTWAESESILVKQMQDSGYSSKVISDLLERKASVDPSTVRAVLVAQQSSADHLLNLATKIKQGTATQAEMLNATQTIAFHSNLQRSIKNYKTNVAQSLSIMRAKSSPDVSFEDAIGGFTSQSELKDWAVKFLDPNLNAKSRSELIDIAATGGIKSRLMSVYINGLLARPGTHMRNFMSNAIFAPMRLAEKMGAVAIGATRKTLGFGTQDQYRASEVLAQLFSFNTAIRDGMSMASHAFQAGYPKTVLDPTKIALARARTEIFDYNADSPMAFAIKGINFFATLPGRSLLTADEFFKGFTYRGELTAYATRNSEEAYRAAIAKGSSAKDAETIFQKTMDDIYDSPPDEIMDLAREATFTKPLEGKFDSLQSLTNEDSWTGFIAKINMPFLTAPINISLQVLERSPLAALGLLSKRVRSDLAGDSKTVDMAMAKIGMGTGIASVMANHAANNNLTGGGPADKGAREALINQGWQPYSMVFNGSLSDEQRALFSKLNTDVRFGTGDYEGKTFVSYMGMEPLGAFLASASNYVDYVKYESDNSRVNEYAVALSYGFYSYMMDQPFFQGLTNVSEALGGTYGAEQKKTEKLIDTLSSSVSVFAGKAVVPLSGMLASVREKTDPYRRDYKVDPNTPILIKGMMEGMNKLMNATPGLSDNLPNKLNIFAEPLQYETDARFHMSPLRVTKGKTDEVNQILIQTHANVSMPQRNVSIPISKGLTAKVDLNTQQYNKLLEIANDPAGLNLKQRILDLGGHEAFVSLPLYQQQTLLRNEFEDVFGKAREILYKNSEYSEELRDLAERKASMIEDLGMGAK